MFIILFNILGKIKTRILIYCLIFDTKIKVCKNLKFMYFRKTYNIFRCDLDILKIIDICVPKLGLRLCNLGY